MIPRHEGHDGLAAPDPYLRIFVRIGAHRTALVREIGDAEQQVFLTIVEFRGFLVESIHAIAETAHFRLHCRSVLPLLFGKTDFLANTVAFVLQSLFFRLTFAPGFVEGHDLIHQRPRISPALTQSGAHGFGLFTDESDIQHEGAKLPRPTLSGKAVLSKHAKVQPAALRQLPIKELRQS